MKSEGKTDEEAEGSRSFEKRRGTGWGSAILFAVALGLAMGCLNYWAFRYASRLVCPSMSTECKQDGAVWICVCAKEK